MSNTLEKIIIDKKDSLEKYKKSFSIKDLEKKISGYKNYINFKNRLNQKDECLIPALCWSTSLWPIVQAGLKPKFVDSIKNFFR